jgi:hypothetical protein
VQLQLVAQVLLELQQMVQVAVVLALQVMVAMLQEQTAVRVDLVVEVVAVEQLQAHKLAAQESFTFSTREQL